MSDKAKGLIEAEKENIEKTNTECIKRLCLGLSTFDYISPEQWVLMLGRVFSLFVETMPPSTVKFGKRPKVDYFKRLKNADIDKVNEVIMEHLEGLSRQEKVALGVFLIGISNPMSLSQVEGYARIKLPVGF